MSTDVRTLLHDLAAEAPRGRGEETADLVVDLHRAQDRRRLRWAGVAAAIAVVVAAVPALVDRAGPQDAAAVASGGTAEVASLFDAPTRGSLADDADAVATALGASWETGIAGVGAGQILDPLPENRHVAFVGEVRGPGVGAGHGPHERSARLRLVRGHRPGRWSGAPAGRGAGPDHRRCADRPLDVAGGSGYVVVVARPEDQVRYSPAVTSLFTADTSGFEDLPSSDGVVQTEVELPPSGVQAARASARRRRGRGPGTVAGQLRLLPPLRPSAWTRVEPSELPSDPYGPLIQRCMVTAGWGVSVSVDGSLSFDGLLTGRAWTRSGPTSTAARPPRGTGERAGLGRRGPAARLGGPRPAGPPPPAGTRPPRPGGAAGRRGARLGGVRRRGHGVPRHRLRSACWSSTSPATGRPAPDRTVELDCDPACPPPVVLLDAPTPPPLPGMPGTPAVPPPDPAARAGRPGARARRRRTRAAGPLADRPDVVTARVRQDGAVVAEVTVRPEFARVDGTAECGGNTEARIVVPAP